VATTDLITKLRTRIVAGAILVAALFTLVQAVDYRQNVPSNDTYQYAKQTLRILGDDQAQAVHGAVVMFCQDSGNAASTASTLNYAAGSSGSTTSYSSAYEACLQTYRNGLTPSSPRYLAIFTSRPGYPLLSAPFAGLFGLRFGLWFAAMLCTILGSFLVILLLRAVGGSVPVALGGQILFLAAPTGYWGSRMLTDGPSLTTTLLALLGALWLIRGRTRLGIWVLVAGLVTGFVVRYSSEQIVALALTVAALVCLRWIPSSRESGIEKSRIEGRKHGAIVSTFPRRGLKLLAIVSGSGLIASGLVSTLLGWPGLSESLQDTFTKHFIRQDVSDPVGRLVRLDLHFWAYYPVSEPTALLLAVGLVAIAVALVRREAVFGVLAIAVSATGLGAVVAHPIASQADRLMAPVWLLVALGLPLLLAATKGRELPAEGGSGQPQQESVFASEAA